MTNCCKKCGGDFVSVPACIDKNCDCHHPKQSTELEGMIYLWKAFADKYDFGGKQRLVIESELRKFYHSGHTAGQAEERGRIKVKVDSLEAPTDIPEYVYGFDFAISQVQEFLSSLNKD